MRQVGGPVNVTVYEWPLWFTAAGRKQGVAAWREGMRVRDVVLARHDNLWLSVAGRQATLDDPLSPGDAVHYGIRPGGPFPPAAIAAPGVATSFWGSATGSFLLSTFASIAVSVVIGLLLGGARGPKKRGDKESATYGFDGLANDRVEGQPRQVIYGYMRCAPQILDEFTETVGLPSETTLFMLCGLGEGTVEAIGSATEDTEPGFPLKSDDPNFPLLTGVQVNGNALENFDGVEAHVRLGSNAQEWIPGFSYTATAYTVDAELGQEQTEAASGSLGLANDLLVPALDGTTVTTDYNSDDAAAQAVWDAHAVTQDATSAADSITAVVDFPTGLYGISQTTGNLKDAAFHALMRYIELDGGGSPITTGGDNNDGWVYVVPTPVLVARQQDRFQREYSTVLYDPQTYAPGARGRHLDCNNGSGNYATTAVATSMTGIPSTWLSGGSGVAIPGFCIEGWFKIGESFTFSAGDKKYLFSWGATSIAGGFECYLAFRSFGGVNYYYPTFRRTNSGSELVLAGAMPSSAPGVTPRIATEWTHLAFNYTRNATTGVITAEVYCNGAMLGSGTSSGSALFGSTAAMKFFRNWGNTATTRGEADEMRIHNRALTPSEVSQSYSNGRGAYGSSSQETLVEGWHCDVATNPGTYTITAGYKNAGNTLTASGGATVADTANSGHVFTAPSGSLRRMKVRVSMLRVNYDSTSQYVQEQAVWRTLYTKLDTKLAYPNTAILGLKIKASEQLNSSVPTVTVLTKGRQCPIYDGSAVTYGWTRNPAWVACDILLNKRYGAGASFSEEDIDWISAKEWADYCDELVYDGTGNLQTLNSGSASDISDLKYDSTLNSGYGGIEVQFWPGEAPPTRWIVGAYVGFSSVPTSGMSVNINYANTGVPSGWEITDISYDNGTDQYTVTLKYDTATYGDPWTDGQYYSAVINPTAVTGSAELREPRFQFDGVMDTFRSVWDTLLEVCAVGRAIAIQEGKRIRFKHERPRDPVALIGHSQIKEGTFEIEYIDRVDATNSYAIDFIDRDQNFARSTVNVDDPLLETTHSDEDLRRENISLPGITRRSQAIRDALFRLKVNRLIKKTGSFESGPDALPLEPGDVFALAHDVVPWGKSGRIASATATTVVLDRSVTLAAATTYYVHVRMNALGQTGSGTSVADYMETVTVSSPAGTYAAGDSITVSSFVTVPAKDDPYVVFSSSEQFLAQVTSTTLGEDLSRKVEWVQYDSDVYDVDTLTTDLPASVSLLTGAPTGSRTVPGTPTSVSMREVSQITAAGVAEPYLGLSWELEPETARHVRKVHLHARLENGTWELARSLDGPATSALIKSPGSEAGSVVEVAIQPESRSGARPSLSRCAKARVLLTVSSAAPEAPSALSAALGSDGARYSWTLPVVSAGLSYEVRRGGWILGDPVGSAPPGSTEIGPTTNWASGQTNAAGDPVGTLYLRSKDGRGRCSSAVTYSGFATDIERATELEAFVWEDYGPEGGWYNTGIAGGGSVTDLQRTTVAGRPCITFTGSSLTGNYTTAATTVTLKFSAPIAERAYVEAWMEAYQVHPLEFGSLSSIAGPENAQWTPEGWLTSIPGQSNCTAKIQMRLTVDGVTGDYVDYKPGVYLFEAIRFRVVFTRPDDTYDVRLFQLHTRVQRIPKQRRERSPTKSYAAGRILNRG